MRRRSYTGSKEFKLYAENTTLGWQVVRRVSEERGDSLVKQKKARRLANEEGFLIGYQLYESALEPQTFVKTSTPSSAAFSRAETEAIVGLRGSSRTAGMSELQRAKRVKQGRSAEDLVETARNKFAVYKKTH